MNGKELKQFIKAQQAEMTACRTYLKLAEIEKDAKNKSILQQIAADEARHAEILHRHTGKTLSHEPFKVFRYYALARILGLTFSVKLMERAEDQSESFYATCTAYPEIQAMSRDEGNHEMQLVGMINEERLEYMGSVVLGLNDALVEFTGALAGFTLALSDSNLIALTGSITGIAAALSMASSEYLSTKSDNDGTKHPVKASIYTGIAYLITVVTLVLPFILISRPLVSLAVMLALALIIIAAFNYYYSVARSESFKRRFGEMAVLSFSVAGISFLIGYLLKYFTGIDA